MGMSGKVVSDITLQSLEYTVDQPASAWPCRRWRCPWPRRGSPSATGNAEAKLLATLPPTAAGATVGDTILLDAEAKQAFQSFARDFQTPVQRHRQHQHRARARVRRRPRARWTS